MGTTPWRTETHRECTRARFLCGRGGTPAEFDSGAAWPNATTLEATPVACAGTFPAGCWSAERVAWTACLIASRS